MFWFIRTVLLGCNGNRWLVLRTKPAVSTCLFLRMRGNSSYNSTSIAAVVRLDSGFCQSQRVILSSALTDGQIERVFP
ncbi:hypothetical protein R3I93_002621 [Phoxinus phoxinus]|uniref:Uncharacterized protein n=1 Tax=Phoxinus phoxinus TaxID=58324 RepID=A0AAN9DH82_9TELE